MLEQEQYARMQEEEDPELHPLYLPVTAQDGTQLFYSPVSGYLIRYDGFYHYMPLILLPSQGPPPSLRPAPGRHPGGRDGSGKDCGDTRTHAGKPEGQCPQVSSHLFMGK